MTTHGDQIFQFGGVPVGMGGPPGFGFFGDHYFVDYNAGTDQISEGYGNSPDKPFKTLSYAISQVTTNQNDVIWVNGYSTVVETSMIELTKSRVHIVGVNGALPIVGFGAGAKVQLGVTTDTSDIAVFKNTGVRNTITGIKFDSANSLTQSAYAVAEGGEYTRYNFCEFYKSTHLTTAAAAEVLCNGDSTTFYRCTFGDLVNQRGDSAKQRPNVLLNRETLTGKAARDVTFEKCYFLHKAAHQDACFVYGSGATDVERRMIFDNCVFWNCVLAAGTIADAVNFAAAQTVGDVLLIKPAGMKVTAIAGASLNIYVASETAQTVAGVSEEIAA